jgi:hypothetical protein
MQQQQQEDDLSRSDAPGDGGAATLSGKSAVLCLPLMLGVTHCS